MIEHLPTGSSRIIGFKFSGKLHDQDYKVFVPVVEAALSSGGKLCLLAQFEDFHGWDLHAAWDDIRFGVEHYADFARIALVGDQKWEAWMANLCKPFSKAEVRYFDMSDVGAAWAWLGEIA